MFASQAQWDPPALAYAFHTSFVDCADGGGMLRAEGAHAAPLRPCKQALACFLGVAHEGSNAIRVRLRPDIGIPNGLPLLPHASPAARKLDVPGSSAAACQLAEKEGFFMDIVLSEDVPPGVADAA